MSSIYDILEIANREILTNFEEIRKIKYNPNVKGGAYEIILKEFLERYLGSIYEFHTRVAILDYEGKALSVFNSGENEFDVAALFKNAVPRVVIELKNSGIRYVPLDAVAFLVEVAQTLNSQILEGDLKKFDKLSNLPLGNRFTMFIGRETTIQKPLKILIYYEDEIDKDSLVNNLISYGSAWDIMTLVKRDWVIINSNLPIVKRKEEPLIILNKNSLLKTMLVMVISLPYPSIVDASKLFVEHLFRA